MGADSEPRLRRWLAVAQRSLAGRRMPWLVAGLAFALGLPALGSGYFLDDRLHVYLLEGRPLAWSGHGIWDLYRFADGGPGTRAAIDHGNLPWWTTPELLLGFFRPLTSLLRTLEFQLFGRVAWPGHLLSLGLYAATALAVARLFGRVLGGATGGLAALLYAVDDAHTLPVTWVANRYALATTAFGVLALTAHLRARERGTLPVLAAAILGVALAFGEMALGAFAYIAAWELLGATDGLARRARGIGPHALVLAGWAVAYRALHYGAGGSGFYVDPLEAPFRFALAVLDRAPKLVLSLFAGPPSELWALLPEASRVPATAAAFVALALLATFLFHACRGSPGAAWLALGTLLSVVPVCATLPDDRMLFFPGIGAMGLVALGLARVGRMAIDGTPARGMRLGAGVLASFHLLLGPVLFPLRQINFLTTIQGAIRRGTASLPADADLAGRTLLVLSTPDALMSGFMLFERYRYETPPGSPRLFRLLMAQNEGSATITREGASSLLVRATHPLFRDPFASVYRKEAFTAGQRFVVQGLDATILEVDARGSPLALRCVFDEPLEAQRWVAWKDRGFVEVPVPERGGTVVVPGTAWFRALSP